MTINSMCTGRELITKEGVETKDSEYPALYETMDKAATRAQRAHFRFLLVQILLLLSIAGIGSVKWTAGQNLITIVAIALVIVSFVNYVPQVRRFDRRWFACRAVAESVKVQTWRFMMKAEPYRDDDDSKSRFLSAIGDILDAQPEVKLELGSLPITRTQVTSFMQGTRARPVEDRRLFYLQERIQDQKDWYSRKATSNARQERNWFYFGSLIQLLAGVVAVVMIMYPDSPLNLVGFITTLATATISWTNARSHRELSQSYAMVAHELAGSEDMAAEVTSQDKLERLVLDVERTISREHTLWRARRLV